jgi:hypothetical protein
MMKVVRPAIRCFIALWIRCSDSGSGEAFASSCAPNSFCPRISISAADIPSGRFPYRFCCLGQRAMLSSLWPPKEDQMRKYTGHWGMATPTGLRSVLTSLTVARRVGRIPAYTVCINGRRLIQDMQVTA